jgi:dCMP deaminase
MDANYRPSKDEYYLNIAKETAERTTCMSVKGGAIIVRDDQIIATGYIGAPRGTKDCFERGNCVRRQLGIPSGQRYEICRSVHAEQNAIINAARAGVSLLGGTVYLYFVKRTPEGGVKFVNAYPCFMCKKIIINAGIKRFVGNDVNGKTVSFNVEDWQSDWKVNDLIDDENIYNSNYSKEESAKFSQRK